MRFIAARASAPSKVVTYSRPADRCLSPIGAAILAPAQPAVGERKRRDAAEQQPPIIGPRATARIARQPRLMQAKTCDNRYRLRAGVGTLPFQMNRSSAKRARIASCNGCGSRGPRGIEGGEEIIAGQGERQYGDGKDRQTGRVRTGAHAGRDDPAACRTKL